MVVEKCMSLIKNEKGNQKKVLFNSYQHTEKLEARSLHYKAERIALIAFSIERNFILHSSTYIAGYQITFITTLVDHRMVFS